jgi:hypothetical protein
VLLLLAQLARAEPTQTLTVIVQGAHAGDTLDAYLGGGPGVRLTDPGVGHLVGTFEGEPKRQVQLRLVARPQARPPSEIYAGQLLLSDAEHEVVAFAYDSRGSATARRIPVSPSPRVELALDPRVPWWISLGWGLVASVGVASLGWSWSKRRR